MKDLEVHLLDDSPAKEDAFGPHQQIANAIRRLVSTEDGGRAIALIGTWGGGKSTVVNLLRQAPPDEKRSGNTVDLEVFVFDAWAHEGDPLRRTFLEKFIGFLMKRGWISGNKWKKRLAELSRRYKETTTTSTPQLTRLGSICCLLLFLIPIGLAIISSGISCPLWIASGFILTLLPPLIFSLIWLYMRGKSSSSTQQEADDVLRYFVNKQKESTKTETVEAPEPTSVEFQKWFHELAEEALAGDKRLLLAIDNLDRVNPDDALRLWSSMRAFIDFPSSESTAWITKLWVLAAFDEHGIERLWQNAGGDSPAVTFLDKTFQIRFRIPAPLLSDWRAFLMKQLKKAFPSEQEADFHMVSQIFAILKAEKKPPTPRDIKVFVNQIGAVYRTSPKQISLPQQALFVALIEQDWDPSKDLPEPERLQFYRGPDWKENLVALYYNMPRETAVQVFLRDKVEKAMAEGKPDLLREQAKTPAVDSAVTAILDARLTGWTANEPHMIGRAAYVLTALGIETTYTGKREFGRLKTATEGVPAWPRLDIDCGMGISVLIKQAHDEAFSRRVVESLSASLPFGGNKAEAKESDLSPWVCGVFEILKGVIATGHENSIAQSFRLGKSPQDYLGLVSVVATCDAYESLWKYCVPGCSPAEVVQHMEQAVSSGDFYASYEQAIDVMLHTECDWKWNAFAGPGARLQSGQQLTPEEIGSYLRILLRLRRTGPTAERALSTITVNGWLHHYLYFAQTGNNPESVASAILVGLICDTEANSGARQRMTSQGRDAYRAMVLNPEKQRPVFDAIVSQVATLHCVEDLLAMRKPESIARAAFDFVFRALASSDNCYEFFRPEVVLSNYSVLKSALDEDTFGNLLKACIEHGGLESHLAQSNMTFGNSGLYQRALRIRRSELLVKAAVQGLKTLSKDDWLNALAQPNDVLPLVVELETWEVTLGLSYPLQDALSTFADKSFSEPIADHITPKTCHALFAALVVEQREVFKKNLRDKIIDARLSAAKLIMLFPDILADCELLASKADELVRTGFQKMLERRDPVEYAWVKRVLQECSQILAQCPKEVKQDFLGRIQETDDGPLSEECKQLLQEICRVCGVTPRQEKPQTNAGEK